MWEKVSVPLLPCYDPTPNSYSSKVERGQRIQKEGTDHLCEKRKRSTVRSGHLTLYHPVKYKRCVPLTPSLVTGRVGQGHHTSLRNVCVDLGGEKGGEPSTCLNLSYTCERLGTPRRITSRLTPGRLCHCPPGVPLLKTSKTSDTIGKTDLGPCIIHESFCGLRAFLLSCWVGRETSTPERLKCLVYQTRTHGLAYMLSTDDLLTHGRCHRNGTSIKQDGLRGYTKEKVLTLSSYGTNVRKKS